MKSKLSKGDVFKRQICLSIYKIINQIMLWNTDKSKEEHNNQYYMKIITQIQIKFFDQG